MRSNNFHIAWFSEDDVITAGKAIRCDEYRD